MNKLNFLTHVLGNTGVQALVYELVPPGSVRILVQLVFLIGGLYLTFMDETGGQNPAPLPPQ